MKLLILFATILIGGGEAGRFSSSDSCSSEEGGHGGGHGGGNGGGPSRPRGECERGWLRFERPNEVWCVKVGNTGVINGLMSQTDAQTQCSLLGATLTGFQNNNERITVANEALKQVRALGQTIGGLWLGATNNAGCKATSCGPTNTFRWTDGHTTGVAGFKWGNGEPDNVDWAGPSHCIQQFIRAPEWQPEIRDHAVWGPAFAHGDLDKYRCGTPATPVTRLYACGKPAASRRG